LVHVFSPNEDVPPFIKLKTDEKVQVLSSGRPHECIGGGGGGGGGDGGDCWRWMNIPSSWLVVVVVVGHIAPTPACQ
jgi:hypothetical protein